ncbi:MAG: hypothetical protein EAZ90_27455 [Oscillatoriales cyanobacterium]|nr:MAG: hypothetical protein EAZ94_29185 [Oscillatoriales cyanobacterium]TAE17932.1 MAG: hypothetical protein EAZ93_30410 [Oscillatoriales cyanobacterium]TAE36928.1 MAG: hypothetical protein EAZ90_27455 [Oscillatoriales cyanobacterium]TAE56130.1 MAG: hypothetical protein EAZ88_04895 [Oscillatoriales cyanobacterium]TAE62978.1 MAG: hypothetical protein EAZ86_29845 [Oscillatoriales cyanobacterium]
MPGPGIPLYSLVRISGAIARSIDRNKYLDILTAVKRTVIPKPHDLGFCFIATASTLGASLWPYVRSTDYPRKPCGSCVSKSKKGVLIFLVDSRGGLSIALSSFPGLPICLRHQFYWTSLVRLSESIVSGGSRTTLIILKDL